MNCKCSDSLTLRKWKIILWKHVRISYLTYSSDCLLKPDCTVLLHLRTGQLKWGGAFLLREASSRELGGNESRVLLQRGVIFRGPSSCTVLRCGWQTHKVHHSVISTGLLMCLLWILDPFTGSLLLNNLPFWTVLNIWLLSGNGFFIPSSYFFSVTFWTVVFCCYCHFTHLDKYHSAGKRLQSIGDSLNERPSFICLKIDRLNWSFFQKLSHCFT